MNWPKFHNTMTIFKLIRVDNWIKNLLIFTPLFFGRQLFDVQKLYATSLVFIGFSLITGFVYIVNDIFDIEWDRVHPKKRNRPIASGQIAISQGLVIAVVLLFIGLSIIYQCSIDAFFFALFYVILNFFYSFKLKHIPIIDFVIVSLGFVIRVLIGGVVTGIELTEWIIIMVLLLSIFIAVSKRRDDVYQYENNNRLNRKVVKKYSLEFMDKITTITSSILIVSYLLFITSDDVKERYNADYLLVTFLFVLIGVFRYNHITYFYNRSGSPINLLFKDTFLQIVVFFWLTTFFLILYENLLF